MSSDLYQPAASLPETLPGIAARDWQATAASGGLKCFPVLLRSREYLSLLLHEPVIDLEMVCAVVAMDPGLAWLVLRSGAALARAAADDLCRMDYAILRAGSSGLLEIVETAPLLESVPSAAIQNELRSSIVASVSRGCVAFALAADMGGSNADICFLAGLLFELLHRFREARNTPASSSGNRVPESPDPAALVQRALVRHAHALNVTQAADRVLHDACSGARRPGFHCNLGNEWKVADRAAAIERALAVARWAMTNAPFLTPWNFVRRLKKAISRESTASFDC